MRALMGLIKDRHGTYYAQKKVPERLQQAVARALNSERERQVFLKKSLGTKDLKAANVAAKHVLAGFDRTIAAAESLLTARPVLSSLTDAQIKRMAEAHYAAMLSTDEEERRDGTGSELVFQDVAAQLKAAGVTARTSFDVGSLRSSGLARAGAARPIGIMASSPRACEFGPGAPGENSERWLIDEARIFPPTIRENPCGALAVALRGRADIVRPAGNVCE